MVQTEFALGAFALTLLIMLFPLSPGLFFSSTLINNRKGWEITWTNAKRRFWANGQSILQKGFEMGHDSFLAMTHRGVHMVLAPKYLQEIQNEKRMSLVEYNRELFDVTLPEFECLGPNQVTDSIIAGVLKELRHSLEKLMEPLSAEVGDALQRQWTDETEWHKIVLWEKMLPVTVQQSSRIFLGEGVCRDPAWHQMVVHYTMTVFQAAEFVQFWPPFLRRFVSSFSPTCRLLRKRLSEIRRVVVPVYKHRRSHQAARRAQGLEPDEFHDMLDLVEKFAKGRPFRPEILQLRLSLGSIQPSSDMLVKAIFLICEHPRLIEELREEIRAVLGKDGWGKTAMYNLKLMDSVLKESQRVHPLLIGTMTRIATEKVKLSDGLEIPKNTKTMISSHHMWDPQVYPDPDQFNGHRFLELRQLPGQEASAQLISTSPVHLGFGHGRFACPGRFLAADLVKMILCHVLIKYDMKFADGNTRPQPLGFGHFLVSDPMAEIVIRRRDEDMPMAPLMAQ